MSEMRSLCGRKRLHKSFYSGLKVERSMAVEDNSCKK